jgi:hypothetical protein
MPQRRKAGRLEKNFEVALGMIAIYNMNNQRET